MMTSGCVSVGSLVTPMTQTMSTVSYLSSMTNDALIVFVRPLVNQFIGATANHLLTRSERCIGYLVQFVLKLKQPRNFGIWSLMPTIVSLGNDGLCLDQDVGPFALEGHVWQQWQQEVNSLCACILQLTHRISTGFAYATEWKTVMNHLKRFSVGLRDHDFDLKRTLSGIVPLIKRQVAFRFKPCGCPGKKDWIAGITDDGVHRHSITQNCRMVK